MTTITSSDTAVQTPFDDPAFDEAQLAAASFLARYSGRTLEAYRQDLRGFFQWAADHDVPVLAATRPHIELWRGSMEERGLAASTIDRRLSTVCGFYRFAHIDGRIGSNPAEYVRRPQVHPSDARGLDRSELGMFLAAADHYDVAHQALAVLLGLNGLRVSEACETNVEDLAVERGHRILRITGKGNKPATIPLVPRTARTIDLVVGERHDGPILRRRDGQRLDRRTAHRWVASIGKRASAHAPGSVHHGGPRRRCSAAGRADRRSALRSQDDDDLRPATAELRSPRRLRRCGLRCRRLTSAPRRTLVVMSDAVRPSGEAPHGTSLLPADLTDDQLDSAPVLDSIDDLLVEELSEDEDDAFAAALES